MCLINVHMHAHKEGRTAQTWHLKRRETVSDWEWGTWETRPRELTRHWGRTELFGKQSEVIS